MIPGTNYVLSNEPCFFLAEVDRVINGKPRRYRIYLVIRSDQIAEHFEDLGPSKNFIGVDQVQIPGGVRDDDGRIFIEHTVAELAGIAQELRLHKTFDKATLVGCPVIETGTKTRRTL